MAGKTSSRPIHWLPILCADEDKQGIYSTKQSFMYNLLYSLIKHILFGKSDGPRRKTLKIVLYMNPVYPARSRSFGEYIDFYYRYSSDLLHKKMNSTF
jgi:hypothetical protein